MTLPTLTDVRNRTDVAIAPLLAERWSPRGFDADHQIDRDDLHSIVTALAGFNQAWTPAASALIVFAAVPERAGKMAAWVDYDLGQAAAHATMQVEYLGLRAHQMGGFKPDAIREAFNLPAGVVPKTVMAVGQFDTSADVAPEIRQRDTAERGRLPLTDLLIR